MGDGGGFDSCNWDGLGGGIGAEPLNLGDLGGCGLRCSKGGSNIGTCCKETR